MYKTNMFLIFKGFLAYVIPKLYIVFDIIHFKRQRLAKSTSLHFSGDSRPKLKLDNKMFDVELYII